MEDKKVKKKKSVDKKSWKKNRYGKRGAQNA